MQNSRHSAFFKDYITKTKTVNSAQIHDIKTNKARNLIRGIDPESYRSTQNALCKIKVSCSLSDYKKSVLYIRTNPFFESTKVGQLFNSQCPKGLNKYPEYNSLEILSLFDKYNIELVSLMECAIKIKKKIKNNELHDALDLCDEFIEKRGASIFLLKIISLITNRYQLFTLEDSELLSKIEKLKIKVSSSNNIFIEGVVTQLSNLRTSHLSICKKISELREDFQNGYIAKSFINPIPHTYNDFLQTLNAFFSFSLFDAFIYYKMISDLPLQFDFDLLRNDRLNKSYISFSEITYDPEIIYKDLDEDTGYYYLRECFLFNEQKRAVTFSIVHGFFYNYFGTVAKIHGYSKQLINNYFKHLSNLGQLRAEKSKFIKLNWFVYDAPTSGMLENSSALVFLLRKKEGKLSREEQEIFVKLMSYTRDIGEICNPDVLEIIATDAKDYLLKLVSQCLITINRKTQYTEHQLRTTIQEYCIQDFDSNLLNLLKYLHRVSPAVTEHLIMICNETFLSTLFHLTEKPVDALHLRADMLNWYGDETGQLIFKDRAKTLKVDIQINKEKGTIDDSRIYVDPLKYQQWFQDNMINKLSMSLDNFMISNASIKLDWSNKNISIGSGEEIIEYLLLCYKEFCENKVFGIASYLGRRIRHGTFKGTAITELKKLPEMEEYHEIFEDKDFRIKFTEWLKLYDEMIDDLVKTSLQIKSKKKPNGLITTEIDSPLKSIVAKQLVFEILSIYSKRSGVIRLPSLIIDFCWRLVEHDLNKTKKLLSEKKSSYGVFSYAPKSHSVGLKRVFSQFTRQVNTITGQKFGMIASWFNKPSYASPSTDIYLLFNAVVSEVKDSVDNFEPKIDLGERSFPLNGGSYYVIYDALYILIHNVARHGRSDGRINFIISQQDERNSLRLTLISEIREFDDVYVVNDEIEDHLKAANDDANNIDDAHIIEGNSGLKKLKKLEKDRGISNISFFADPYKKTLSFEFDFELNVVGKYNDIDN